VLIDLYDRRGGVAFLWDREFLTHVKSHLTETGCVVLNVLGPGAWCRNCIGAVQAVFGNPVIRVQVEADGNLVLLAFKSAPTADGLQALQARSEETKQRFGLEHPGFLQALRDLGRH
jgi:spermidine synthase